MKTLNLHVDYIKFKALKKALKNIDELGEAKSDGEMKDALAVLAAVEKGDSENVVEVLVKDIKEIAKQVNTSNVVLYPYAHLSKDLASPENALNILKKTESALKKEKFNVVRAPFGYYKEFELKVKGHPLSELSRDFKVKGNEAEEKYDPKQLLREISKAKLDTSKLKENDHRIIGGQMDLFSFNEVAPGMVFWHNNGLIIYTELIDFWREMHRRHEYLEIKTPQIMDSKLWKISGHWDLYKENNFKTGYEKRDFLVKPMNCPGGMLVYKAKPKSYKDLPLRVGELGVVHRVELSGVLAGLFRVIQFTQDDAHIFCTEKQVEQEIIEVISLIDLFFKKFGFDYNFTLSTRSDEKKEKYLGDDKYWANAEGSIKKALNKLKIKFTETPGEAKFYGPSLDVQIKDSLGREWQCSTIQFDAKLPERFELEYTDKDNKKKRPIMLHRVIYGSLERFIGILLEHTNGRLPTWLAPVQCRVLSFTDRNVKYSEKIIRKIGESIPSVRLDADFRQTTVPQKVKEAEIMRIPYIIVAGDKEEKSGEVAVRVRGSNKIENYKLDDFIEKLKMEIRERKS